MTKKQRPIRIAIIGGIGSGKSYICRKLIRYPIYSCDERAKQIMQENTDVKRALIELVGEKVYEENGALNKVLLTQFIQKDREHLKAINNIVHPAVASDFNCWVDNQTSAKVFMECAILYESGFQDLVDRVVLVHASIDTRIKRIMQRNNVDKKTATKWINIQEKTEKYIDKVDLIIENED